MELDFPTHPRVFRGTELLTLFVDAKEFAVLATADFKGSAFLVSCEPVAVLIAAWCSTSGIEPAKLVELNGQVDRVPTYVIIGRTIPASDASAELVA